MKALALFATPAALCIAFVAAFIRTFRSTDTATDEGDL